MAEELLSHKLTLDERKKLTLSGVTEVVSFEDTLVALNTNLGTLMIHGQNLQLKSLSLEGGQVAVEGSISAFIYEEPRNSGGGWLRRLFG